METIQIQIKSESIPALKAYLESIEDGQEKEAIEKKVFRFELNEAIAGRELELADLKKELKGLGV